jgi:hypothetical protein
VSITNILWVNFYYDAFETIGRGSASIEASVPVKELGTLDLDTKTNFSIFSIEVRIDDYLGKPVGTLGVVGFDMEPAGLATLPGVPVGAVVSEVGTLMVFGLVEPSTPAPLGLILELGMVASGVVGLTLVLGSIPGVPIGDVVVAPAPGFFMVPVVVGFLTFLVLVLGLV